MQLYPVLTVARLATTRYAHSEPPLHARVTLSAAPVKQRPLCPVRPGRAAETGLPA